MNQNQRFNLKEFNQPGSQVLGEIELEPYQINIIKKYRNTILYGTFAQAATAFEIIFRRAPKGDTDMGIFKALCLEAEAGRL